MPILAQYTIRSKQSYIFRSNHLKEIVGGSEIIRDTFKELFRCAKNAGLVCERDEDGAPPFSMETTRRAFDEGELDAVELFCGGGNDTVLFRDHDAFRRANEAYTRHVLEQYPGLLPLCVGVAVEGVDYRADYHELMAEAERRKNAMQSGRVENAQPFSQLDRSTLQAICREEYHKTDEGDRVEYRSAEADAKYRKGNFSEKIDEDTKLLDDLAKDGTRSLLAIVHADGNRMGVKIQNKLGVETNYDFCVNAMRAFTREIDSVFTEEGKEALERRREELAREYPDEKPKNQLVRWIVTDGDDMTFLCNAKYALELAKAYLRGVKEAGEAKGVPYSSCAGICVFHAHYPFARAYELAEQACDNAKKPVHKTDREQAWIDFHYQRGGVNGELNDIRELHLTDNCIARPWFVCGDAPEQDAKRLGQLEALNKLLRDAKVVRGQIKTIGQELEVSREACELAWKRLCYNYPEVEKAEALFNGDTEALYRALYDLSDFCDLWFRKGGDTHG